MSTRKGPGAANYLMSMTGAASAHEASQAPTPKQESKNDGTGESGALVTADVSASGVTAKRRAAATTFDAPVLRMALALTPENAKYLEVVRTMRRTNKTALVNQAIEAMRAADTEYEAMRTAYDAFTSFRV